MIKEEMGSEEGMDEEEVDEEDMDEDQTYKNHQLIFFFSFTHNNQSMKIR